MCTSARWWEWACTTQRADIRALSMVFTVVTQSGPRMGRMERNKRHREREGGGERKEGKVE